MFSEHTPQIDKAVKVMTLDRIGNASDTGLLWSLTLCNAIRQNVIECDHLSFAIDVSDERQFYTDRCFPVVRHR